MPAYTPINAVSQGEALAINIPWELNSAEDLFLIAVNGTGTLTQDVPHTFGDGVLTVPNPFGAGAGPFVVFVYRAETPAQQLALSNQSRIDAQALIAQFEKDTRVLEQLSQGLKTAMRSADNMAPLPHAPARAGKILAFDENGNPNLSLSASEVQQAILNGALASDTPITIQPGKLRLVDDEGNIWLFGVSEGAITLTPYEN